MEETERVTYRPADSDEPEEAEVEEPEVVDEEPEEPPEE